MRSRAILAVVLITSFATLACSWADLYAQFFGSADTRFLSCSGRVYEQVQEDVVEELWGPVEREDVHELCFRLPDWAAQLRQLKTTYDGCPDPTDPRLLGVQAHADEMYDELLLAMDMLVECCDDEATCDLVALDGHWSRVEELGELLWREIQDYADTL